MADFDAAVLTQEIHHTLHPPILIMESKSKLHSLMAHHKNNIQFYKTILLDNYTRSQQTGEIPHMQNASLYNMIQRHKILLQHITSQLLTNIPSPPPILPPLSLPTIPLILHTPLHTSPITFLPPPIVRTTLVCAPN